MKAAKHVLRYLRKTTHLGLCYGAKTTSTEVNIAAYCDADWGNDKDERKSTTGFILFFNGSPIIWNSKRQHTVALSSAEAEYMAMSDTAKEILWCLRLVQELNLKVRLPIELLSDSMSAIAISKNDGNHQRTKHIDIRHHFVRELAKNGTIKITWVPTKNQVADILTTNISTQVLQHHQTKILSTTP